jgi:hypothetical protein
MRPPARGAALPERTSSSIDATLLLVLEGEDLAGAFRAQVGAAKAVVERRGSRGVCRRLLVSPRGAGRQGARLDALDHRGEKELMLGL